MENIKNAEEMQGLAMVSTRLRGGNGVTATLLVMGRYLDDCLKLTTQGLVALRSGDNLSQSLRNACGPAWRVSQGGTVITVKEVFGGDRDTGIRRFPDEASTN